MCLNLRYNRLLTLFILCLFPLTAIHAAPPLKVAFVTTGPLQDFGWNRTHEYSRQALARKLGNQIRTRYVKTTSDPETAQHTLQQLAQEQYALIFVTDPALVAPTLHVAKQSPHTLFMICGTHLTRKNVGSYAAREYQPWYISGILAGRQTHTHAIGYIGTTPNHITRLNLNAFTLGAQSVNPNITVYVKWIGDITTLEKVQHGSRQLIDKNIDTITQALDSEGVGQIANQHGVSWIGYYTDMSRFSPKYWMTAPVFKWDDYVINITQSVLNHRWHPYQYWGGIDTGITGLASFGSRVDDSGRDIAISTAQAFIAHKIKPFSGPLYDTHHHKVLDDKQIASDRDILQIDYYIEGITVLP